MMKITVKEAKVYTTDDFKAAAEEERFKNRAEIWADQFNRHAEYIGLKDRARVEKDLHGCDSVVWDYGYIVAKDPFGDKWQVRFGDNAYTMDKLKVTPYVYGQMDSMTGFKGEAKKQERQGYADNDVRLNGEDLAFVVTGVTTEDRGYDLAVSVKEGETYTLDELGYEISGMCENCNGYPTATRYDDILVVAIQAPVQNDEGELTEDYWDAVVIEGYVKVVGDKLDDVAAYLEG